MTQQEKEDNILLIQTILEEYKSEIERLKKIIHELWNEQYPNPHLVQDKYEQFKTENNL